MEEEKQQAIEEQEKEVKEGKKRRVVKRKKQPKVKIGFATGKRKESIARAVVKKGRGKVLMNKIPVSSIENEDVYEIITSPLRFLGKEATEIDVSVNVKGGGVMGQAQASRTAIAKALVEYLGDKELKMRMIEYDRSLLVDDSRRVEPKKYKGRKARARFQKSYR